MTVIAIVGPTAVGKSELGFRLAQELDAEILSADSRQVYRYMDIGTAKPSRNERAAVRHHMLDLVEPSEPYSVHDFQEEGMRVLKRLEAANRIALVIGGTGFYVQALLEGMTLPPVPPDEEFRERLRQEAERDGPEALHRRLAQLDPASGKRIDFHNLPRLVRALELVHYLGGPIPAQPASSPVPALYIGVTMDRAALKEQADRRVAEQVRAGLVEEVRLLLAMGYGPDSPGMQGFGYREIVAHLEGRLTLAEAIDRYRTATHQYIRRQMTWFRRTPNIRWIDIAVGGLGQARADVMSLLRASSESRSVS